MLCLFYFHSQLEDGMQAMFIWWLVKLTSWCVVPITMQLYLVTNTLYIFMALWLIIIIMVYMKYIQKYVKMTDCFIITIWGGLE